MNIYATEVHMCSHYIYTNHQQPATHHVSMSVHCNVPVNIPVHVHVHRVGRVSIIRCYTSVHTLVQLLTRQLCTVLYFSVMYTVLSSGAYILQ